MLLNSVRDFSKRGDALPIPNLVRVQQVAYDRFLQNEPDQDRDPYTGLEGLLREVFPIVSYDGNMQLEYLYYKLDEPRYTPDECRELRLTFGMPFRVAVRLVRKDVAEIPEEEIYLGEIPVIMGGGEFIINGAERVIVNQLHRSPGVDFSIASAEADRPLHSARIIPERGSWIELEVSKKDILQMRIDQSTKIPATTFLRALDEDFSTTDALLKTFYNVETIKVQDAKPEHYVASPIIDTDTGEELVPLGAQIGDNIENVLGSSLKTIEVIANASDMLILNTIADEKQAHLPEGLDVTEHEAALLALYARLRPGNPPQVDKARDLFAEKFYDENRYRLGKVGRFRINRKFDMDIAEDVMHIRAEDFLEVIKYMLDLRNNRNKAHIDDIDHLGNRRLRTLDELAVEEMRKGFLKLRRTVQERMSVKDPDELAKVADLINSKAISSAIDHFFARSELSQVVEQTNPLSQLRHERVLSALGPGGLNRKRAGFEVRDVHISHYGRICPIETPEGTNIGLIASLGIYSQIDEYGFLQTPYRPIKDGKAAKDIVYLRADEEMKLTLGPTDAVDVDGKVISGHALARVDGDLAQVDSDSLDYVDISPKQIVGVSAAMIPFLEHDDANRALMGSNMQRQAVPLIITEPSYVATGMEKEIPKYSGMVVRAKRPGTVTYVDAMKIVVDNADEYELRKFVGLNERTCQNQKPLVEAGQRVKAGDLLADGCSTDNGELALGKNVLVAFMPWKGYNFEDAIVISERVVKEDVFTSVHIEEFEHQVRDTKRGQEELTREIPNVSEEATRDLDERGIVRVGAEVNPGDIIVGKITPKGETDPTPEEKLLRAIFGDKAGDVKDASLKAKPGMKGVVIHTQLFSRRKSDPLTKKAEERRLEEIDATLGREIDALQQSFYDRFFSLAQNRKSQGVELRDGTVVVSEGGKLSKTAFKKVEPNELKIRQGYTEDDELNGQLHTLVANYQRRYAEIEGQAKQEKYRIQMGDELPPGIVQLAKVYVAKKRKLQVGDKMAGRHGNKGVVAKIVPREDMPFLEDGTPVDICLNPLGVPSRMNLGQIFETLLGWAGAKLGETYATPPFDGAKMSDVEEKLKEAGLPESGRVQLYDGETGDAFDQTTTVGMIYMLKLSHLVEDKIHARSIGPYSLITQQPLGGKAQFGGQRFGEMEVWALYAYGAANVLRELLTVKSDDVEGRSKTYEAIVKGEVLPEPSIPESFNVLTRELMGLGLEVNLD
jgi:DNA-directed RNA polymerase subunit beta